MSTQDQWRESHMSFPTDSLLIQLQLNVNEGMVLHVRLETARRPT